MWCIYARGALIYTFNVYVKLKCVCEAYEIRNISLPTTLCCWIWLRRHRLYTHSCLCNWWYACRLWSRINHDGQKSRLHFPVSVLPLHHRASPNICCFLFGVASKSSSSQNQNLTSQFHFCLRHDPHVQLFVPKISSKSCEDICCYL